MSKEVQQPEPTEAPKQPQLTLDTLAWAARIIDAASRRGAIHANEMTNVGRVYDELAAYVEFYRPKKEEDEQPASDKE